jgi:serine protease Do
MEFQDIIEIYQPAIIQISANGSSGTGFFLEQYHMIVTNEHVVGRAAEVTIAGRNFAKVFSNVWYTDKKHDLAFIQPPTVAGFPRIPLGDYEQLKDGDEVVAIGHPYGLNYTATQGVISKAKRVRQGLHFIQIDAAINPGNSGGPLVNSRGEVIGVNTFIIRGGDNLGFALPVSYLKTALDLYLPYKGSPATRCPNCNFLVLVSNIE